MFFMIIYHKSRYSMLFLLLCIDLGGLAYKNNHDDIPQVSPNLISLLCRVMILSKGSCLEEYC